MSTQCLKCSVSFYLCQNDMHIKIMVLWVVAPDHIKGVNVFVT
jgi:hypothetical protein